LIILKRFVILKKIIWQFWGKFNVPKHQETVRVFIREQIRCLTVKVACKRSHDLRSLSSLRFSLECRVQFQGPRRISVVPGQAFQLGRGPLSKYPDRPRRHRAELMRLYLVSAQLGEGRNEWVWQWNCHNITLIDKSRNENISRKNEWVIEWMN